MATSPLAGGPQRGAVVTSDQAGDEGEEGEGHGHSSDSAVMAKQVATPDSAAIALLDETFTAIT